jgi:hypothetical protein
MTGGEAWMESLLEAIRRFSESDFSASMGSEDGVVAPSKT